jgi:uncharacterized protein with GYD domain
MATRVVLAKYSRGGRRDRPTAQTQFGEVLESLAEDLRGRLVAAYRTRGPYDYVVIVRIPDSRVRRLAGCLTRIKRLYRVRCVALGASPFRGR